jgi:hypothetical protein
MTMIFGASMPIAASAGLITMDSAPAVTSAALTEIAVLGAENEGSASESSEAEASEASAAVMRNDGSESEVSETGASETSAAVSVPSRPIAGSTAVKAAGVSSMVAVTTVIADPEAEELTAGK